MKQFLGCLVVVVVLIGLFGWVFPPMVSAANTLLVLLGIVGSILSLAIGCSLIYSCVKSFLKGKIDNA